MLIPTVREILEAASENSHDRLSSVKIQQERDIKRADNLREEPADVFLSLSFDTLIVCLMLLVVSEK